MGLKASKLQRPCRDERNVRSPTWTDLRLTVILAVAQNIVGRTHSQYSFHVIEKKSGSVHFTLSVVKGKNRALGAFHAPTKNKRGSKSVLWPDMVSFRVCNTHFSFVFPSGYFPPSFSTDKDNDCYREGCEAHVSCVRYRFWDFFLVSAT